MSSPHREPPPADAHNPLGIEGIEFIEYRTARPQALGQVLEMLGFRPVARHRSREVLLYRQGDMNIVVNAHRDTAAAGERGGWAGQGPAQGEAPPQPTSATLNKSALDVRVNMCLGLAPRMRHRAVFSRPNGLRIFPQRTGSIIGFARLP